MKVLRIIAVSILIVLTVINMVGLQIVSVFSRTFLEPSFYERVGTEQEFYAQIRQLIFRLSNRSLPNGQEGMPYFEKALTESWLKEEINELIDQFLKFVKGQNEEPPIIPIYKLKEKVAQSIEGDKTWAEKERLAQYWFDPLPGEIRLQDFISTQAISGLKEAVMTMYRFLWILMGTFILLSALIYLSTFDWKTAVLWIATAMLASGLQVVLIGVQLGWLMRHTSQIMEIHNALVAFEIPQESAWGLLQAFKEGFAEPLIMVGAVIALIGGVVIYLLPIKERSLTLVK